MSKIIQFFLSRNSKFRFYQIIAYAMVLGVCFQNCGLSGQIDSSGKSSLASSGSQHFDMNIPFAEGTDASYQMSDVAHVQLKGGVVRLLPIDQIDMDNSTSGFGSAAASGTQWDATNKFVRLSSTTNNSNFDASWTPQFASLAGYWTLDGSGSIANGKTIAGIVGPTLTANNPNGTGLSYATGQLGQAINFDGVDDYLVASDATLPSGTSARSMCAWGTTNTLAAGYALLAAYGTAATNEAMTIGRNGSQLFVGGYSSDFNINNGWTVGTWTHICVTYYGTTASLGIRKNKTDFSRTSGLKIGS